MKIILSIVPEIWSMTDRIFFHFGPFLYFYPSNNPENQHFEKNENCIWRCHHFTHVHHKWKSYDVLFLRYGAWQTELFPISDYFLPFYPPNNPENQNFEKMKKKPGDIINLHKCTKNHYHMLEDMERDACHCYFS